MTDTSHTSVELNEKEANLVREWFCAVRDLNPAYLEKKDGKLYTKIMKHLEEINPEWKGKWNV